MHRWKHDAKFLVEQHKDNLDKAHIYLYSTIPFPQMGADSTIGLEIKGSGEHGIAFCFPSIHKDGQQYEILGTNQPITLTKEQSIELMQHVNHICLRYGKKYLEKNAKIAELKPVIKNLAISTEIRIFRGERHNILLSDPSETSFYYGKGKTIGAFKQRKRKGAIVFFLS